MTVYRKAQLMISAPESQYGTAATLDRWLPYQGSPSVDWTPNDQESDAIYPGPVAMDSGSYRPTEAAVGSIDFETKAKGFGRFHKAAFGNAVVTLVSAGLYQHNFTLSDGPYLDALTMQLARLMTDGTFDTHTYIGCVINTIEWKMDNQGTLTETIEFDGRTMSTVIAIGTPTVIYPNRFPFAGFSVSTGVVTEPTTILLGGCATPISGIKSWSLKIDNNIQADDYRGDGTGLKAQPPIQQRKITGTMEADNTPTIAALRTNWKANTGIAFNWNFINGTDQMNFLAPYCRLTSPPTPNADGQFPTVTLAYEVRKLSTASQALFLSARTADTLV